MSGVAVDVAGNILVADAGNNAIRKVTVAGVVIRLAGSLSGRGSADGTGSTARFDYPTGVAVDSAGNAYVADDYNDLIRKVTPAGIVTTLEGGLAILTVAAARAGILAVPMARAAQPGLTLPLVWQSTAQATCTLRTWETPQSGK
jgi:DNA-binding beta-propeller fold protein YncE